MPRRFDASSSASKLTAGWSIAVTLPARENRKALEILLSNLPSPTIDKIGCDAATYFNYAREHIVTLY
jgi:hypothetical protein